MISSRWSFCRNLTAFISHGQTILAISKSSHYQHLTHTCGRRELYETFRHHTTNSPEAASPNQSKEKQNTSKLILKTPKGTYDHGPRQMALRRRVFRKIETIFQKHGAQAIDTPVFELTEVLTGKYGDDSKLVYNLADQGGEHLSLRYDLTIPLARYLAMNKITNLKRYHIGKVYRRDSPRIGQGRFREFYQCDFDIVGTHDPMLPDIECVKVTSEILRSLNIGQFQIKLNHRELLNGLFEVCGVPSQKFKSICSTVDKLDKLSWHEVRQEMINEKGLNENVADKIGVYTQLSGHMELINKLMQDDALNKLSSAVKGLDDLKRLLNYCHIVGIHNDVIVDLSLARGLDYYTGTIFEAVLRGDKANRDNISIGSIAAGGRYDNLIGVFDAKGHSVPCVGVSIGVERIFAILQATLENDDITRSADVYVISAHKGLHEDRLKLINRLWAAGIRSEHSYKENPKILHQIQYCEKHKIPLGIIIGCSELEQNIVKLRIINSREEIDVPNDNLEDEIRKRLTEYC